MYSILAQEGQMQSTYIEAFLAAVQTGSFSKAAEQLYITQPTLTHRIQSLEKELNAQLFDRRKGQRVAELTDMGKLFLPVANRWAWLLSENSMLFTGTSVPAFSVGATQTLSSYVMPEVYSRFLKRNYPVELSLYTLHFAECYQKVETRQVNAVFVSKAMASPSVSTFPICKEKMVLLCRKDAPYRPNMRPAELDRSKCIYMRWSHEFEAWHDYHFSGASHPVFADNMRLTERILNNSDRWAIVPISAAAEVASHTDLVHYDLQDPPPDRPIYLLTIEPRHEYTDYIVEDLTAVMNELMSST